MSPRLFESRLGRPTASPCPAIFLALLLPAGAASAAEWNGIKISGFVDLYVAAASDQPAIGRNFAGLGTVATREGELALDLAGLELRKDPAPWGFTLVLAAGDEMETIHAAEEPSARDTFRNVYQASVGYKKGDLLIEAGLFPSHIGFEGALPHTNWSYSHSWVATLSPFYQTGVKLVYTPDENTTIELHALNGWQQIADFNDGKSAGLKLSRRVGKVTATFNAIRGDEPTPDGNLPRSLYDLILQAEISPTWSLAVESYRGQQQRQAVPDAGWKATAAWLRWSAGRNALTVRAERFDDEEGGISGKGQKLESYTATWVFQTHESAKLFLELRRDESTADFFPAEESRRQDLAIVALALAF
jgi:hypothetical protein